jgi:DNA polymerase-4
MTLRCLYVDFNSYFASVEQYDDENLRGLPGGGGAGDGRQQLLHCRQPRSWAHGIRTGTGIGEARALCPDVVVRPARPDATWPCTTS